MRVGVGFTPFEMRADVVVRLAVRAEAAGVEAVGVAEGWTHDAVVLLAEVAQRTDRIGIGTSVLSVWSRSATTLAMSAAGLRRCSGGRFVLGLGAGSPSLTEGVPSLPGAPGRRGRGRGRIGQRSRSGAITPPGGPMSFPSTRRTWFAPIHPS